MSDTATDTPMHEVKALLAEVARGARIRFESAEAELDSLKRLASGTVDALKEARADLSEARKDLDDARAALKETQTDLAEVDAELKEAKATIAAMGSVDFSDVKTDIEALSDGKAAEKAHQAPLAPPLALPEADKAPEAEKPADDVKPVEPVVPTAPSTPAVAPAVAETDPVVTHDGTGFISVGKASGETVHTADDGTVTTVKHSDGSASAVNADGKEVDPHPTVLNSMTDAITAAGVEVPTPVPAA